MRTIQYLILLLSTLFLITCSISSCKNKGSSNLNSEGKVSDSPYNDNVGQLGNNYFGKVTFDIEGDVEGSKEGCASLLLSSIGATHFSFHDADHKTFSLKITWAPSTPIVGSGRLFPGEGTYDIVSPSQTNVQEDFVGKYTATKLRSKENVGYDITAGTITITEYNNEFVEGTFNIFAERIGAGESGSIIVTNGKFKAINKLSPH